MQFRFRIFQIDIKEFVEGISPTLNEVAERIQSFKIEIPSHIVLVDKVNNTVRRQQLNQAVVKIAIFLLLALDRLRTFVFAADSEEFPLAIKQCANGSYEDSERLPTRFGNEPAKRDESTHEFNVA